MDCWGFDLPQWRVIKAGSQSYMKKLIEPLGDCLRLNTPIKSVRRKSDRVILTGANEESSEFDHVVFACHSDQAVRILGEDITEKERQVLSCFPYEKNSVVLHTDTSVLPKSRRAWACWNYFKSKKTLFQGHINLQHEPVAKPDVWTKPIWFR